MIAASKAVHKLKIWPEYYKKHVEGKRSFEVRKNDRGFDIGDEVELWPYDPERNAYLSDPILHYIIVDVCTFQQRLDYVVLALQPLETIPLETLPAGGQGQWPRPMPPPDEVKRIAEAAGGKIDECFGLPDGSGGAVISMPLPKDHWLTKPGYNVPPMPFRLGTDHPRHPEVVKGIWEASKYAVRASTMNGRENDFDPDAMCQNMVVGMIGYHTPDGLSYGSVYLDKDPTQLDPTAQLIPPPPVNPLPDRT